MSLFLDPFDYAIFGRALIAAVFVGALTGALGPFVIVRRMAYIGQGLSQSVLGGVGVALVFGAGLYSGAAAAALVAIIAIYLVRRRRSGHLGQPGPQPQHLQPVVRQHPECGS